MEKELNTNNSNKRLIIGVSILFSAVILIIGATTAYFTQSDTKEMGNIVSININDTIVINIIYIVFILLTKLIRCCVLLFLWFLWI